MVEFSVEHRVAVHRGVAVLLPPRGPLGRLDDVHAARSHSISTAVSWAVAGPRQ